MKTHLSFSRIANFLLVIVLSGYLLYIGQFLLAPLAFSLLFAFMLKPLCAFMEARINNRFVAILLAFFVASLPIIGILVLFSYQLTTVIGDLDDIGSRLANSLQGILGKVEEYLALDPGQFKEWTDFSFNSLFQEGANLLTSGISSSSAVLAGVVLTVIFTFFFLLYRRAFKNFILIQFEPGSREEVRSILETVQAMTRQYLFGMLLVMAILGVLNSLGLWLIGIEYALFWGFLAAFLAIVPYLGTTLGGTLPFLYALATGTWWQPLAVVALYFSIQQLEGNLITPKVVGGRVDINPLAAIIGLFLGGMLWGVSGLILALPVLAGLKVTMQHIPPLEPLAQLLDSRLFQRQNIFFEEYDETQYRLGALFRKKDR